MTSLGVRRRCRAPLVVGALAVAAAAVLYVRDPRVSSYLPCPIHTVTGLWCPGCGSTRAFGDLVHGELASALSTNVLAVVLLAGGAAIWGMWLQARVVGRPWTLRRPSTALSVGVIVCVVAFTVLRNVPAGSWLAP